MTRTITITAMARPALFRDMLASLRANTLDGWSILVGIEPGPLAGDMAAIAGALLAGTDHEITVNPVVLGITHHPYRLIDRAFAAGADFNLHLEEDFLLAPDATSLALWYQRHHRPHWLSLGLMAGPCGSAGLFSDPACPDAVYESGTFNAIGFGARVEEWRRFLAPTWLMESLRPSSPGAAFQGWHTQMGWDWAVFGLLAAPAALRTIQPVLARATHTGRTGTFARPDFHDRAFGGLPLAGPGPHEYRLVPVADLPRPVRSHIHMHQELMLLRVTLEQLTRRLQSAKPRRHRLLQRLGFARGSP